MLRALCILTAVVTLAGCSAPPGVVPRSETTQTVRPETTIVDSGVADAAAGTVDYDDGILVSYTAAEGDHFDAIAMRFGLATETLALLNPEVTPDSLVAVGTVIALR